METNKTKKTPIYHLKLGKNERILGLTSSEVQKSVSKQFFPKKCRLFNDDDEEEIG